MHNDVRLSQTTPILLAVYQVQQGVVTRATQRRDDLRSKLAEIKSHMNEVDTQIAKTEEEALKTSDHNQKQGLTDMAENLKSLELAPLKKQEQDTTNDLQDAETALAKEQNTLTGIKNQLDNIVKKLQPAGI
jgi:chromosome segregation ATPase